MTEEELRKFDKETLVLFIVQTSRVESSALLDCLNILERSVQIQKLLDKSKTVNGKLQEIWSDDSKTTEFLSLLKQGRRIDKKLEKLFNERNDLYEQEFQGMVKG